VYYRIISTWLWIFDRRNTHTYIYIYTHPQYSLCIRELYHQNIKCTGSYICTLCVYVYDVPLWVFCCIVTFFVFLLCEQNECSFKYSIFTVIQENVDCSNDITIENNLNDHLNPLHSSGVDNVGLIVMKISQCKNILKLIRIFCEILFLLLWSKNVNMFHPLKMQKQAC